MKEALLFHFFIIHILSFMTGIHLFPPMNMRLIVCLFCIRRGGGSIRTGSRRHPSAPRRTIIAKEQTLDTSKHRETQQKDEHKKEKYKKEKKFDNHSLLIKQRQDKIEHDCTRNA